ncbi:MAG: ATPase [Paludibacteraceae bacterium]|nr:ATPase [Paludibacteraceae bacterium]
MKLIADSGSTKTTWALIDSKSCIQQLTTDGINPYYESQDEIAKVIEQQLFLKLKTLNITEVWFYGAGCNDPEKNRKVSLAVSQSFGKAEVHIDTDLTGAARALCKHTDGIVCILGTGSNSCLYQDGEIKQNTSPLGFILGDEGSGAVLGRQLVADYLKGQMPDNLQKAFQEKFQPNRADILNAVYRQPFPNRYLASFTPFLSEHIEDTYTVHLINNAFDSFIRRNITPYGHKELPLHFVGSVAYVFRLYLQDAVARAGYRMGKIVRTPMEGLIQYHL